MKGSIGTATYLFYIRPYWGKSMTKLNYLEKLSSKAKARYNVNPPKLLEFQRPVYPKNLRERDVEGRVMLKILIDKEGKAKEIQFSLHHQ